MAVKLESVNGTLNLTDGRHITFSITSTGATQLRSQTGNLDEADEWLEAMVDVLLNETGAFGEECTKCGELSLELYPISGGYETEEYCADCVRTMLPTKLFEAIRDGKIKESPFDAS